MAGLLLNACHANKSSSLTQGVHTIGERRLSPESFEALSDQERAEYCRHTLYNGRNALSHACVSAEERGHHPVVIDREGRQVPLPGPLITRSIPDPSDLPRGVFLTLALNRELPSKEDLTHLSRFNTKPTQLNGLILHLDRVKELTPSLASAVAESGAIDVQLNGLTTLSLESAQRLMTNTQLRSLSFESLKTLSPETAQALSGLSELSGVPPMTTSLNLNGINALSVKVAQALAPFRGRLSLQGVKSTSDQLIEALSQCQGGLVLNGIQSLTLKNAEALVQSKLRLDLTGVKHLDIRTYLVLAKSHIKLSRDAITVPSLSVEDATSLAQLKRKELHLNVSGAIDSATLSALLTYQGTLTLGVDQLTAEHAQLLESTLRSRKVTLSPASIDPEAVPLLFGNPKLEVKTGRLTQVDPALIKVYLAKRSSGARDFSALSAIDEESLSLLCGARSNELNFERLTELSEQQARIMSRAKTYMIKLDGLERLSIESARLLAKRSDQVRLSLRGLKEIDPELAQALSRGAKGLILNSDVSRPFEVQLLLAANPSAVIQRLSSVSDEQLKMIMKHSTWSIHLDGLRRLSVEQAKLLSQLRIRELSLGGLSTLSLEVTRALSAFKGRLLLNGLKELSLEQVKVLKEGQLTSFSFDGLEVIDVDVLKALLSPKSKLSSLRGLRSYNVETAELLGPSKLDQFIKGISSLDEHTATYFAKRAFIRPGEQTLAFDSVLSISPSAAERISQTRAGALSFASLKQLSDASLRALSRYEGRLALNGLTELSPAQAKILSGSKARELSLGGLSRLNASVAQTLMSYHGHLALDLELIDDLNILLALYWHHRAEDSSVSSAGAYAAQKIHHITQRKLSSSKGALEQAQLASQLFTDTLDLPYHTAISAPFMRALCAPNQRHEAWLKQLESIPVVKPAERGSTREQRRAYVRYEMARRQAKRARESQEGYTGYRYRVLSLGNLPKLDQAGVEGLLACPAQVIRLTNLRSLSPELAQALSATTAQELHLPKLASDQVEAVREAFANYKGKLIFEVQDEWLKAPSQDSVGVSNLDSVKRLSLEQAKLLARTRKSKTLSLNGLTEAPFYVLKTINFSGEMLSIDGLTELSMAQAEVLASMQLRSLSLNGVTLISPEALKLLTKNGSRSVSLKSIKCHDIETAASLGGYKLREWVSSLKRLEHSDAQFFEGREPRVGGSLETLAFDAVEELSAPAAKSISNTRSKALSFPSLRRITDESLTALMQYAGSLELGLETISLKQAEVIRQGKTQALRLKRVHNLDSDVAQVLLRSQAYLEFNPKRMKNINLLLELYWYYFYKGLGAFSLSAQAIHEVGKSIQRVIDTEELDLKRARVFSQLPNHSLRLRRLKRLSDPVLTALCTPNKRVEAFLSKVESMPEVKRATRRSSDEEKAAYMEYMNLQMLSRKLKRERDKQKGARYRSISLDALTALDLPTARALVDCPSQAIELGALSTLNPEVAKALSESSAKRIKLTGLASGQVEAIKEAFANFKGRLQLPR